MLPDARAMLAALEVLAGALPPPGAGADGAQERPMAEDLRRSDLLAVCYRLLFAELAADAGLEVTAEVALSGLATAALDVPAVTALAAAARDALRSGAGRLDRGRQTAHGGGVGDLGDLGRLHEELLAWRLVGEDAGWAWRQEGRLRKAGGSYFTPASLVEHLLDETLDPVLAGSGSLPRVLDPACGAGAFLVPAARRLTARAVDDGASLPDARRAALAAVHGVDLDPAVLELARVCLWLDTLRDLQDARDQGSAPEAAEVMLPVALVTGDAVGGLAWQQAFPDVFVDGGRGIGDFAVGDFCVGDFEVGDVDAGALDPGGFDVVVGNPPFANQLERLTARRPTRKVAAYTDLSAVFLLHALTWVRPGGRVGFVQPQSVLSTRDAAPVRRAVVAAGALTSLWVGKSGLFDAAVPTCALVVAHGAEQTSLRRWQGPTFTRLADRDVDATHLAHEWGFLLAAALGVPEVGLVPGRVLGDLADCTADFRDQYYGLEPYVRDAGPDAAHRHVDRCTDRSEVPLVTSGLIDPAACRWGQRSTRFLKQTWQAPVVDLDAMTRSPQLTAWAARRLVPKVLLATQGKVLEAVADPGGAWLPSVPVVTICPHDAADLWRVLAVLLAPPVCAVAATRYAGSALNPAAVKLSAKQVAGLPLPVDEEAWATGALQVREAQEEPTAEGRREALLRAGRTLCAAYGFTGGTGTRRGMGAGTGAGPQATEDLLAWWAGRLPAP